MNRFQDRLAEVKWDFVVVIKCLSSNSLHLLVCQTNCFVQLVTPFNPMHIPNMYFLWDSGLTAGSSGPPNHNFNGGIHAERVLSLHAAKRIFFSATLRNAPDFDFGLRPAIRAGVIKDYTVMVPVLTEGDPRPSLVELIKDMSPGLL